MLEHDLVRTQIEKLRGRTRRLDDAVHRASAEGAPSEHGAFREIQAALEELQVAQEELNVSNESLAEAQRELEVERQRYVDLFQSAPDAYFVTDPAGVIREANLAASAMVEVDAPDLNRKPLFVYVALQDRRAVRRHLLRAARGDALPAELELVIQPSRGGEPVPAVLRVARLHGRAGEVVELRCMLHDLSEHRALEVRTRELAGERVARDGVEQANRLKTEFLSMFSHELRTPLNAIIAYAELLEMGIPVRMPETCRSYVQAMDDAARHLLVLVEEMLGFARIEAGAYLVRRDPVPLQELAREVAAFIGPLAARKGVAVNLDLPDAPVEVRTDRVKARQILINLLSNAVKFTAAGEIRVRVETLDGVAQVHVADTGIGIAPEHLERIFDPFWQVKQGLTRDAGGVGLGLTICQRLAELLEAEIAVRSTPGTGTTFTLALPLAP